LDRDPDETAQQEWSDAMRNADCHAVGFRTVAHLLGGCASVIVLLSLACARVSAQQVTDLDAAAAHLINAAEHASIAAPVAGQQSPTTQAPANATLRQVPVKALLIVTLGTDVITSLVSLEGGAHEANPFVLSTHPAPFIAQAVAWGAAEVWILNKLSKQHSKLAKTLAYIQIGGSIGASIQNGLVIRRQRMR
jgi:hypothetical protein